MAELFLVRHGQASFGTGNYDRLSALGERQGVWLGEYFAERGIAFDRVVTGSMRRHRQTADAIFRGLGSSAGYDEDPGLNEYDFRALYGAPLIVLDMGTATTISVIGRDSSFLGGAIVPGVNLSINALASNTSLLQYVTVEAPKKCIGTNTVDSMKSGAVFGNASMIDGMIDRIEEELGENAQVVATGGLASSIAPHCRHKILCDNDILMKGLWILYEKNKK